MQRFVSDDFYNLLILYPPLPIYVFFQNQMSPVSTVVRHEHSIMLATSFFFKVPRFKKSNTFDLLIPFI